MVLFKGHYDPFFMIVFPKYSIAGVRIATISALIYSTKLGFVASNKSSSPTVTAITI